MHKYKIGQRCELLPPASPKYHSFVGQHTTVVKLLRSRRNGAPSYIVDALPRVLVPEYCLRPLDDKWAPPLGEWREITKLCGADIRKAPSPAQAPKRVHAALPVHFNCRCALP